MQMHQYSRLQQVSAAAGFIIVALQTSDKCEVSEGKLSTGEHKQIDTFTWPVLCHLLHEASYIIERNGLKLTELACTGAICLAVRAALPAAAPT